MEKVFSGKNITIRQPDKKDLNNVRKFLDFINNLVEEGVQILASKKLSLKEEKEWLKKLLNNIKTRKTIFLLAEDNGVIAGTSTINLRKDRASHVGEFGISIRKEYRGMGLGSYLMKEILKLAKKELKPKIFRLSVYPTNKVALNLYKKNSFKEVARVPKQIQYHGKLIDEIIMISDK